MPDTTVYIDFGPKSSKNPSEPRTLATVLTALQGLRLPDRDHARCRSTILSVAGVFGQSPENVPLAERDILSHLHRVHPREIGVSPKRLQNMRSDFKRVLKLIGWSEGGNKNALSKEWRSLYDQLPTKFDKCSLSRFLRHCSGEGISPGSVNDETVLAYRSYLDRVNFCRTPSTMHRDLCRTWNKMVDKIAGWPQQKLSMPTNNHHWSLDWDKFLPSLREDVEAWLRCLRCDDPLDERAPLKAPAKGTVTTKRQQTRMFASAIVLGGTPVSELKSMADLVTLKNFRTGLRYLRDPANDHGKNQPVALAICMASAARSWVQVSNEHWRELRNIIKRIQDRKKGMTDKNKAIVRQLNNEARRADLLGLPPRVFDELRRLKKLTRSDALRAQLALAVELELMTALRRKNLTTLNLDRHLRWTKSPHGNSIGVIIDGSEVKNGEDTAFDLHPETVRLLETYLEKYHPLLVRQPNRYLFPGNRTNHKTPHRLSEQVKAFVFKETGLTVTLHSFRHIAGKLNLEAEPSNYEGTRQLLGHKNLQTTLDHYVGLEREGHFKRFSQIIEQERAKPRPVGRRKRKPFKREDLP